MRPNILFYILILVVFNSCESSITDPYISFRTRTSRLRGHWRTVSYSIESILCPSPDKYKLIIVETKDNLLEYEIRKDTLNKTMVIAAGNCKIDQFAILFNDKPTKLHFYGNAVDAGKGFDSRYTYPFSNEKDFFVDKLTKRELILSDGVEYNFTFRKEL